MYNSVGNPANRTWHIGTYRVIPTSYVWHALSHIGTYRIIPTSYIWHALWHIGTYKVILTYRVILTSYVWHTSLRMFYGSLFVLFVLCLLVIVLSVLLQCTVLITPLTSSNSSYIIIKRLCLLHIYRLL